MALTPVATGFVGQLYRFWTTTPFTDDTQDPPSPIDPSTIEFRYQSPAMSEPQSYTYGTEGSPIVRDAEGVYHCDIELDVSGRWTFGFYAPGQALDESLLTVYEAQLQ